MSIPRPSVLYSGNLSMLPQRCMAKWGFGWLLVLCGFYNGVSSALWCITERPVLLTVVFHFDGADAVSCIWVKAVATTGSLQSAFSIYWPQLS